MRKVIPINIHVKVDVEKHRCIVTIIRKLPSLDEVERIYGAPISYDYDDYIRSGYVGECPLCKFHDLQIEMRDRNVQRT
jgi:hypothetical protein